MSFEHPALIRVLALFGATWTLFGPTRQVWAQLDPANYAAIAPSWTPAAGTITINTDNLTISGVAGNGVAVTQPDGGPEIAAFTFGTINIAAGVTINVTGSRALALLAQDDTVNSFVMNGTINASGGLPGTPTGGGAGPGGFRGGNGGAGLNAGASGSAGAGLGGAGAGGGGLSGGGGAGFGGPGGEAMGVLQGQNNFGGLEHGNLLEIFHGGSGGGGGGSGTSGGATNFGSGGAGGGGAIELVSNGQFTLGGTINANGGAGGHGSTAIRGGGAGGGSGGGVILAARTFQQTGTIALQGGTGGRGTYATPFMSGIFTGSGGGGGGGGRAVIRVPQFVFDQTNGLNLTNVNLGGAAGGIIVSSDCNCAPPQVKAGQPGQPGKGRVIADELVISAGEALILTGTPEYTSPSNANFRVRGNAYRVDGSGGALTLDQIMQAINGVRVANGGQANITASSLSLGANSISGDGSADSGIHYAGATVVSGKLKGTTTHTINAHVDQTVFDSTLINADATVQQNGTASFNSVANGGTVANNANTLDLVGGFNAGTLHINHQTNTSDDWFNSGKVHILAAAMLDNTGNDLVNTGRIYVGTPENPGGVIELNGTTLRNDGTIYNNGSIEGDVVNGPDGVLTGGGTVNGNVANSALVSPGNSPGALTINGDYAQSADGKLLIELGSVSSYDRLLISGEASLAGMLNVDLINDFEPTMPRQSFAIMHYGSHTGAFDSIVGQPSATLTGLFWTVEYTTTQVILSTSAIPGDLDLDGDVDLDDYAPFSDCLGGPGVPYGPTECENIDLNADGSVDLRDFAVFQAALAVS